MKILSMYNPDFISKSVCDVYIVCFIGVGCSSAVYNSALKFLLFPMDWEIYKYYTYTIYDWFCV